MSDYSDYSDSELLREIEVNKEKIEGMGGTAFMRMLSQLQIYQIEHELQHREIKVVQQELAEMYDYSPLAYFTFDSHGLVLELNLAGATLLGMNMPGLLGVSFVNHIVRHERSNFLNYLRACISGDIKNGVEFELELTDGKSVKIQTAGVVAHAVKGNTDACRIAFIDVTEQRIADLKLRLTSRVLENTHEGIMLTDAHQRIVAVNPAFLKTTGYNSEEVIGYTPAKLKSGHHNAEFYREMNASFVERDGWQGEIWNRRKNGEIYPEWVIIKVIRKNDGEVDCYIGIFSDISNQVFLNQKLEELAYYDELTGLANRSLLYDRLQQVLLQSRRDGVLFAVFFLDFNHFEDINDNYGYGAGDRVLKEAAERLVYCMREGDTLSRLEGDEFVAILRNLGGMDMPAKIAERMVKVLDNPFIIDGAELFVTASVGISVFPKDGEEVTVLLKNADTALYCAKELGRNTYQYYEDAMNKLAM